MLTMPEVVSKSVTRAEFFEVGCPAGCKYQTVNISGGLFTTLAISTASTTPTKKGPKTT